MTADHDYAVSAKLLTREDLDRQIARLTAPPRPVEVRDPFPVCPTVRLPASELERMTERLYTQSLQKRAEAAKRAAAEQERSGAYGGGAAAAEKHSGARLTEDEVQASVERLYTQSLKKKKLSHEEAAQREGPRPKARKVVLSEFVQHMYTDRLEAKKRTEERLYRKYIASTEVHSETITTSQLAASAERLSSRS